MTAIWVVHVPDRTGVQAASLDEARRYLSPRMADPIELEEMARPATGCTRSWLVRSAGYITDYVVEEVRWRSDDPGSTAIGAAD